MSVHEDLLNNGENNCSFTEDEVDIMCSKDGDDAYRNLCFIVQTRIKAGRLVNGIRNIAEEIVLKELVYI